METPNPKISNCYVKHCIAFLDRKITASDLKHAQIRLDLTEEQAIHILRQARNLTGKFE